MTPRIVSFSEKKLVGTRCTMSLANDKTAELWSSFMPRRKEIKNKLTNELISMQVYSASYFIDFNPATPFEKWAAIEVSAFENIPPDMETFTLSGGTYAIFDYKGASGDPRIFQYIFEIWLPNSTYTLDDRPHFEVLGDRYKNAALDSEEAIWIPVISLP